MGLHHYQCSYVVWGHSVISVKFYFHIHALSSIRSNGTIVFSRYMEESILKVHEDTVKVALRIYFLPWGQECGNGIVVMGS